MLASLPKTLRQLSFTQWEIPKAERNDGLVDEELDSEFPAHAQTCLPGEMARLSQRLERFCPPWQMDTAAFLLSIIELGETSKMPESSLKHIVLRCLLPNLDESGQDFRSLVILAAKAALFLPQLEVIELWGTCIDEEESHAYIFRYIYEDGRGRIVWRSSEGTMVAQKRIVAKWTEVAQKQSSSALEHKVILFVETGEDIYHSDGTFIYRHLLLKDLLLDPITQIILENEPHEWCSSEESDSPQQGHPPTLNLANPNSMDGNLLTGSLGLDADLVLLQAELMAFDAEVNNFLQKHQG